MRSTTTASRSSRSALRSSESSATNECLRSPSRRASSGGSAASTYSPESSSASVLPGSMRGPGLGSSHQSASAISASTKTIRRKRRIPIFLPSAPRAYAIVGRDGQGGLHRGRWPHQGRPHRAHLLHRLRSLRRCLPQGPGGQLGPQLRRRPDRHHGQRGVRESRQHRDQGRRSARAHRHPRGPHRDRLLDRRRRAARGLLQDRLGRVREHARARRRAHEDGDDRGRHLDHVEDRRPRGAALRLHDAGADRAGDAGLVPRAPAEGPRGDATRSRA